METNDSAFDFNLYTDFWHNQRGPPFFPVVTSAPAPPSPPPSAPPPPPPNTMNGHKRHRVDCRKLSWEQLSPDVVNRDTIWKKVILPYWFHFTKFLWMLFNCFAKYTFTAWLSSLLLIEANSQTFVPGSILSCNTPLLTWLLLEKGGVVKYMQRTRNPWLASLRKEPCIITHGERIKISKVRK